MQRGWKLSDISTGSLAGSNPFLCGNCQIWNNVAIISSKNQTDEFYQSHAVEIPLHTVPKKPDCLICDAVFSAARTRLALERREGRVHADNMVARNLGPVFLDHDYYRVDRSQPAESRMRLLLNIIIYTPGQFPIWRERAQGKNEIDISTRICLRHTKIAPTRLLGVEPWESPFFNVGLLKSWISACEDIHADPPLVSTSDDTNGLPADFRVIDIRSMNIKRPRHSERFIALSYMWHAASCESGLGHLNTTNLSDLEATNGLRGLSLPRIISDAMALCRALGERYLWVDRLCIVQDDEISKHGQIRTMDVIYNSAAFTIMAALNGRQSSSGLPGCPRLPGCPGRPRNSSAVPLKHNKQTRSAILELNDVVGSSLWNSRGWTFQERLLSRRRLFITESQVIFQCSEGTAYEDFVYMPLISDGKGANIWRSGESVTNGHCRSQHARLRGFSDKSPDSHNMAITKSDHLEYTDYVECIIDYTQRQLTFRADVLDAFNGVGNVLARGLGTSMLFGLPEKYLHMALQWSRSPWESTLSASSGVDVAESVPAWIPSWSWASTSYPVVLPGNFDSSLSLIDFHYYEPAAPDQKQSLRVICAREALNQREELVLNPMLDFASSMPLDLDRAACDVARRLPGSLIFNTSTTTACRLEWTADDDYYYSLVESSNNDPVGVAYSIDEQWAAAYKERLSNHVMVKLVLISSRALFEDRPLVLLVEPDPREPLAVRRAGFGEVKNWVLWQRCEPQWETVVLC